MTEEQAIREIQEHINSGKVFILATLTAVRVPWTAPRFNWRGVNIHQPVTLVRVASPEEFAANMPEERNPPRVGYFFYEAVID
jgi:hypothetical protein